MMSPTVSEGSVDPSSGPGQPGRGRGRRLRREIWRGRCGRAPGPREARRLTGGPRPRPWAVGDLGKVTYLGSCHVLRITNPRF